MISCKRRAHRRTHTTVLTAALLAAAPVLLPLLPAQTASARTASAQTASATPASGQTAPGQTAPATPDRPYGTVTSPTGVNEREYPSTDSSAEGILRQHEKVGLRCKVHAQVIDGNAVWYLLRDRDTWVSAAFVANTGDVPLCKNTDDSGSDDARG
ncbi:SH3 domain-containing protein [Kitasatospora sp. NPDC056138]|uniref:SH3 domain-containing protein n=1 Tax=Kitasatospora sp. NPDC056138 TaxID=3345724 RepID=UPI0035E2F036